MRGKPPTDPGVRLWSITLGVRGRTTGFVVVLHTFSAELVEAYGPSALLVARHGAVDRVDGLPIWRGTVASIPGIILDLLADGYTVEEIGGVGHDPWQDRYDEPPAHGIRFELPRNDCRRKRPRRRRIRA